MLEKVSERHFSSEHRLTREFLSFRPPIPWLSKWMTDRSSFRPWCVHVDVDIGEPMCFLLSKDESNGPENHAWTFKYHSKQLRIHRCKCPQGIEPSPCAWDWDGLFFYSGRSKPSVRAAGEIARILSEWAERSFVLVKHHSGTRRKVRSQFESTLTLTWISRSNQSSRSSSPELIPGPVDPLIDLNFEEVS